MNKDELLNLIQSQREQDKAKIEVLRQALEEIASRGPVHGYTTAGALILRLVETQSIARKALSYEAI